MTKTRLLSTVAASILLGVGVASAQSPNTRAPERAPAAQQGAPAEKVAPPMRAGERKAPETTGQSPKESAGEMKGKPAERSGGEMKAKPDERGGATTKSGADKQGAADTKSKAEKKAEGSRMDKSTTERKSKTTTGQGAAAGSGKLSAEQRTKITAVIKRQKVRRIEPSKLNVSIRVGVRVPSSIRFYPLPAQVVTIYPQWRGYDYILVGNQILVLDPRSHEIIAILQA